MIAAYVRAQVIEIPIDYLQRSEGSTSKLNTIGDGLKIVWFALINWLSFYPLQPLGVFAAFAFAISGILGVQVFIIYFELGQMPYFVHRGSGSGSGIGGPAIDLRGLDTTYPDAGTTTQRGRAPARDAPAVECEARWMISTQ